MLVVLLVISFFITTSNLRIVKKVTLLVIGLIAAFWLSGCSMIQPKKPFVHTGYVCYTNAQVIEVKNVREQLKFLGPATKPEKKKMCDVVVRTDQDKVMTTAQEGSVECSTETVNQRRMIYVYNEQIVGISHDPDPFLEEQNSVK
ncbi:MAG: hypothetical protein ACYC3G_02705 [Minisyncoccota bacterium]